jgi:hypothetical protein
LEVKELNGGEELRDEVWTQFSCGVAGHFWDKPESTIGAEYEQTRERIA